MGKKKQAMDAQMRHIIEEKNTRDKEAAEKAARSKQDDEQNQAGLEGHAVRLMEDGMEIELGKDLASKTLAMEKKAPVPRKEKPPKEPKEPKPPKERAPRSPKQPREGEDAASGSGSGDEDKAKAQAKKPAKPLTKAQKK